MNLFRGRIESGKSVFGPLVLSSPEADVDGRAARLFVRPYDLDINRQHNGRPGLRARVTRVHSAGPQVRVELLAETGESIMVEMSHERYRETRVTPHDQVYVSLRDARIFTEDYSI